jgi:magnesium-transporting ATPase (P-type)
MLKKYARFMILAFIQGFVLLSVLSVFILAVSRNPALIDEFKDCVHTVFNVALCIRLFLYSIVFFGWERFISWSAKQKNIQSINVDRKAKYIFLVASIVFEVLFALGGQ